MSYQHDIDTDPRNPANAKSLDIVACWCRTCQEPTITDNETKSCPVCGDLIMYQENDGTLYTYDNRSGKYEVFE
jgi:RNA polymerase subunit RPABC4/transcription elongation factor Spt4